MGGEQREAIVALIAIKSEKKCKNVVVEGRLSLFVLVP